MKRNIQNEGSNNKNSTIPAKKIKRADVVKDNFALPKDALNIISQSYKQLTESSEETNRVLRSSYHLDNQEELQIAKEILRTYGFVKFKLSSKTVFDDGLKKTLSIQFFMDLFYQKIKSVFEDVYGIDISDEKSIIDGKKGRNNRCWPTSLNVGKIGPVHIVRKREDNHFSNAIIQKTQSQAHSSNFIISEENNMVNITQIPIHSNNPMQAREGHTLDLINQSLEAYYLKAYFCYDVFASLLDRKDLLTSVEPTTMVFHSSSRFFGKKMDVSESSWDDHSVSSSLITPKINSYASSIIAPLTRLVYSPGVLSKESHDIDSDEFTTSITTLKSKSDQDYDVLKSNPWCGILGVTNGDCIGLVPGAHIGFDQLLEYMRQIRHTDKRTIYSSTPPEELKMDQWMIQIPLNCGDILIYDRRIPSKINSPIESHSSNCKKPFIGLNVSFYPNNDITKSDRALRSIAYIQGKLGSGLRIFGHVQNTKRRGTPIIINDDHNILKPKKQTTTDPLIRKIIGLEEW